MGTMAEMINPFVNGASYDYEPLDARRLAQLRMAYTTRFVAQALNAQPEEFHLLNTLHGGPQAGDVVLAKVTRIGNHTRLQAANTRRQRLFVGQEVLVAYGNRYAPDQFLAHVPNDLGPCHLVAGGGVASRVEQAHASVNPATELMPVGLLARAGQVVNLRDYAPQALLEQGAVAHTPDVPGPPVVVVLGSSMNSGKSTTVACLINGLTNAGLRVAAAKATGTGAGNDPTLFTDAGAVEVRDFTDYGFPTTYLLDYLTVRSLLISMIEQQRALGVDAVIIEIADGLFQGETGRLLRDEVFNQLVDSVVFSSQDALGAVTGERVLRECSLPLRAISGVLTASPLAASEAREHLQTPVVETYELCNPLVARGLLAAH
ncbi:DUF1611 domain-containing protein [Glutamicibacter endophyticus]